MSVIDKLEPQSVLKAFEAISRIPHGSMHTKAISDFCLNYAKERGYQARQDETNNVVIVKPASPGYENAATVILQGHMDMVCEKAPGVDFDFTKDALHLAVDGDWLHAEGTTLGADDGIAVAICLAILDDPTLPHPRLEMILTTEEEVGLDGAKALDMADIQGRKLINIDSEEEGYITVSCAGGGRVDCSVEFVREAAQGTAISLKLTGLLGGHSGVEINKGRASANALMGRLLLHLALKFPLRLIALSGGTNDNAIASGSEGKLLIDPAQAEAFLAEAKAFGETLRAEYLTADPGLTLEAAILGQEAAQALTDADSRRVIDMIALAPQGIQEMSMDIPGLVQTSLNMGILRMNDTQADLVFALRSSVASQKEMMAERLFALMERLGGKARMYSEYPAWAYQKDSELRELMCKVYREQTGKEIEVVAIHAGLECGLFCGKIPDMDCVSIGPDILGAHTPQEKVSLASVKRIWEYVLEVLKQSK